MDLLCDVVTVKRSGRPSSARVAWHAPWGQRFPSVPGSAGFQVILQGSCWLIPPSGDPVALGVGDVLFAPRGIGYGLADSPVRDLAEPYCDPTEDSDLFVSDFIGQDGPVTVTLCGGYRLAPGRAHPLLQDLPDLLHLPARLGHHPELRAAVDLLGAEVERPHMGADTVVLALLDTLLIYILRAWFADLPAKPRPGWATAMADPAISAALSALHRDPARPWTVKTLADQASLSRAAFSQRFAAMIGQPPLTYLTWWRLTLAARMLRESDAPLSEVATQVGYGSEFSFANAFKREYGTAPGRYRRQAA
ncbi:AraC family transcriptional regulator [Nonomuraea basaltis]|uniref:AraC family transcriptional regulator n=1 Tax=Nonomuraea basaltis TaxID=2495887 RepID=UPI00110C3F47|nr:AraC family transcriptional regulator [Nonomuraea basaltis]TMR89004.1 AraC family transcriptional regulator [Nonomuraea basaltis]